MNTLRRLIDAVVFLAIKRPWLCLLVLCISLAACFWQVKDLSFDSSVKSFLHEDDPVRLDYLKFEQQYGLSAYFIVLVEDNQLFTVDGINRFRHLNNALAKQVGHLEGVESIINARVVKSDEDDINIQAFLPEQELNNQQLVEKKQLALSLPFFKNRLINHDASAAVIILRIKPNNANVKHGVSVNVVQDIMRQINQVLAAEQKNYSKPLLLGGSPTIGAQLTQTTRSEMLFFSVLALVVVVLSLFAVFRRVSAVILPMICLLSCIFMVLAIMTGLGYSVQVSSIILPSFLLGVGVADAIHFLRSFYPAFKQYGNKQKAIMYAIDHTGVAMFFATLTTSVGLLSFCNSNVASIADFGYFAAIGSWIAYFLTIIVLPAGLMALPIKATTRLPAPEGFNEKHVTSYVAWLDKYHKQVLAAGCVLLIAGLAVASQISFKLDVLQWFDQSSPLRMASEQIDKQMAGTIQIELLINNKTAKTKPLTAKQLEQIDVWLEDLVEHSPDQVKIGSIVSVLDVLKQTNKVLQNQEHYSLPETDALLAQEILLLRFDGQSRIDQLINQDISQMRVTISVPWMDSYAYESFVAKLAANFQQSQADLSIKVTGMASLTNQAFKALVHSMLLSYVYAGLAILVLMMLLSGKWALGFWAMLIPNITPIVLVLALMQLLSIPLDMFTVLIGSIAIGLIVDDTIHLIYSFQRFYKHTGSSTQALIQSFVTTGRALVATSVILFFAFLIYCFSSLNNLVAFGYLTAICIALALIADLMLLPALLLYMYKNKKI